MYLTVEPAPVFVKIVRPHVRVTFYDTSDWVDAWKHQPYDIRTAAARLKIENHFQVRLRNSWEVWSRFCPRKKDADKRQEQRDGREVERSGG